MGYIKLHKNEVCKFARYKQGKRHIYTLIFGGGYDDQGEAVLNPIQFDAETTGWVDADKDVNVQP